MKHYEQQIVIDLEFTPTPKCVKSTGLRNEVIEIGAVKLDAAGQSIDNFSTLVKPELSESIAPHIQDLTGIRDSDVKEAPFFAAALRALAEWVGSASTRLVAWSKSDQEQIVKECELKGVELPAQLSRWLDLQVVFPKLMGIGSGEQMALRLAADWCGSNVSEENSHRALYDATVTAELMRQVMTGEYLIQKAAFVSIYEEATGKAPCTATLGSTCDGLAALLAEMTGQTQATCAG